MKKIIALILSLLLLLSMAVPASAATPTLDIPDISIPDISGSIHVELPDEVLANWFEEHPAPILKPIAIKPIELQPISRPSWLEWLIGKYT